MPNVPSDWNSWWTFCSFCGERYHQSEPHDCDVEDEEEENDDDE